MVGRIGRALAGASLVAAALVAPTGAAVAAAAPTVTVEPTTDLVEGQRVNVQGSGFPPGTLVVVAQCDARGDDLDSCDFRDAVVEQVRKSGRFEAGLELHRAVDSDRFGVVDCAAAPGTCVVAAFDFFHPSRSAAVPLSFDPEGPPALHPMRASLAVQAVGTIAPDGTVRVHGTIVCNQRALALVEVRILQPGQPDGAGTGFTDVRCGPTERAWEAVVAPEEGMPFTEGRAVADVEAALFDRPHGGGTDVFEREIVRMTLRA